MEFFGDSDSNGFGSDGEYSQYWCFFKFKSYENCAASYSALLARNLNARYHVEAWSGKGVVKNAPGTTGCMPMYWNRTIAVDEASSWDFARYIPDVVIVYLGSNDFYSTPNPSETSFSAGYAALLGDIARSYAPHAPMIVSVCGGYDTAMKPCPFVRSATEAFASTAYPNARYVDIPTDTLLNRPDDYGCMDHRNLAGQAKIAAYSTPIVRDIMGWAE
eukprot:Opistho-2@66960